MPEICPRCGREFANATALGSHLHYRHVYRKGNHVTGYTERSESERRRFRSLLEQCLSATGLKLPQVVDKIELALIEIPLGVSPALDRYRQAFNHAWSKEKLLREVEELLRQAETE